MEKSNGKTTKATMHNKRSKGGKAFNANHNTLECTREMQSHIDQTRFHENVYYRFTPGKKPERIPGGSGGFDATKHEKKIYKQLFEKGLEERNQRYIKNRNKKRCREIKDLYQDPKTAPMETIFQVSNSRSDVLTREEKRRIAEEAWKKTVNIMFSSYKDNMVPLDASLHMEEQTPHIHFRCVFVTSDENGTLMPNQTQALEEMGFQSGKRTRYDNALIRFTDHVREVFYQECEKLGLEIDREVVSPSKRQKDVLEYQVEQLTKEKDSKQEELDLVNARLESVTRSLERSEAREKELKQLNNQLTNQVAQLNQEKALSEDQIHDLDVQIIELNRQNAVLRHQTEELERKVQDGQKKAEQVEQRITVAEEYEDKIYGKNNIKREAKVFSEIPKEPAKTGLSGKIRVPAQPRKYIVDADQYDELVKIAQYNVKRDYGSKTFVSFKRELETNDVQDLKDQIQKKDEQIRDLQGKNNKLTKELNDYDYYLEQRGLVQDFIQFGPSHDIEHGHHRKW